MIVVVITPVRIPFSKWRDDWSAFKQIDIFLLFFCRDHLQSLQIIVSVSMIFIFACFIVMSETASVVIDRLSELFS